MKYLFIDLEFASSRRGVTRTCEFGYVVTDEFFNVAERGNLIINPAIERREWDWSVVDKILTRSVSEYEKCPKFSEFYKKIKYLIIDADRVIGHSTVFDVKAINCDTFRYNQKPLNFSFVDISVIYRRLIKSPSNVALAKMVDALGVKGEDGVHDAGTDAYNTMLCLKAMTDTFGLSLDAMCEKYPEAVDTTKYFNIVSVEKAYEKHTTNPAAYIRYLKSLEPDGTGKGRFEGKKVCISRNLQVHHINKVLNLARMIINEGGSITLRSAQADIYMSYDIPYSGGVIEKEYQLENVILANASGASIEIIDYFTLLNRLGTTEEEIKKRNIIPYGKRAIKKRITQGENENN